jgi:hypothetical protein
MFIRTVDHIPVPLLRAFPACAVLYVHLSSVVYSKAHGRAGSWYARGQTACNISRAPRLLSPKRSFVIICRAILDRDTWWLACRSLLQEGGYHYATFCGGESADGAPTLLQFSDPRYDRKLLDRTAHNAASACRMQASGQYSMTMAIDARRSKNSIARGRLSSNALLEGRAAIDSCSFHSDPLEPISAALRSSVLLEAHERRERAGGPPLLKAVKRGTARK